MPLMLAMTMLLGAPDPTLEQATICSATAAGMLEGIAADAAAPGATDAHREDLRLVQEMQTRSTAKAVALRDANLMTEETRLALRDRVIAAADGFKDNPWAKLDECIALFGVK